MTKTKRSIADQLAMLIVVSALTVFAGAAHAARTITGVTLNGGAVVTVAPGASITAAVDVTTNGSGDARRWRCTSWWIENATTSTSGDEDHGNHDSAGDYSESFTITAPATAGTYNARFIAYRDNGCSTDPSAAFTLTNAVIVVQPPPTVLSINRADFDPVATGTPVAWTVVFSSAVTGVDASDFALVQAGGAVGASIQSVTGAGTTWTVSADTGIGAGGTLRLNLTDNDSIRGSDNAPLGGAGAGNGNFTGQFYTLLPRICTPDLLFCDDFERSNVGTVGNGWTVTPANCTGTTGNNGCAGIDSDIPPFNNYARPRPNPTRSMFTRWDTVTVQSPTVNLAGRAGAQLSFWMRRGDDSFSECPEAAGENYLVRYRASDNTWKILAQYPSAPSADLCAGGVIYLPVIELPADALHANFAMQFYQPSGSGTSGSGGASGVRGYDYWHMDNVIIRETPGASFTGAFCDNFEGGLGRWSISAEGAPGSAAIGDARLGTLTNASAVNSLDLRWGYVAAATFKTDLTGVGGDITYWLRSGTTSARDPDSGENLVVEYLNSSGVWTNLTTYLGSAAAGTTYNGSHPIPDNAKHAGFRLRFRMLNGSGYDNDYWHLDDVCVGNQLTTADLAITKTRNGALVPGANATYTLSVVNNGPGTLSGSIEVVDTLPAGLSYLASSGTGWSCGANGQVVTCGWSGTLTNGSSAPPLVLTVRVEASASGTLVNTATVSGTVNDNVPGNNTATDTANLFSPGYVFTDAPCANGVAIGTGCNLIDWSPLVAGVARTGVYITALNSSGVPTQLSATVPTSVSFQFGLSCIDPAANAGIQASFSALAAALPLCAGSGAAPTGGAWSGAVSLSFPAASPSVGPYAFTYGDVGKVELYMRNSVATTQQGSSGPFVVKPYGFVLTEIKPTANQAGRCAVATTPAPAIACSSAAADAAVFVRAGEAFSVTVTAVNGSGNATPNYGKEASAEAVKLTPAKVIAAMTSEPALAGSFGSFGSGTATGTAFSWGEVGIITLTPAVGDGDYLGVGDVTGTASGNVGRFYPDHFDVTVTPQCGGFIYAGQGGAGQPFTVSATARNAAGGNALNYSAASGFARAVNLSLATGGGAGSLYVAAAAGGNGAIPAASFVAGVGTVAHNAAVGRISYGFTTFPTLPTAITVHAEDADSVTGTALLAGSNGVASALAGRLQLSNAYGSELLPLVVPVKIQSWTATGWATNVADSCTRATLTLPTNGNGGLSNALSTKTTASLAAPAGGGDASLRLSTPGAGNAGLVDISGNVLRGGNTWLALPVPSARACFGVCGPRSPVIYLRESY
ncbi:MAG: DUF11 domain-containing protein [Dechloromonas sp.]|nr:DUF11 domain-containing protein [Dechloromonas sp.]